MALNWALWVAMAALIAFVAQLLLIHRSERQMVYTRGRHAVILTLTVVAMGLALAAFVLCAADLATKIAEPWL